MSQLRDSAGLDASRRLTGFPSPSAHYLVVNDSAIVAGPRPPLRLLVLGGTAEARDVAAHLAGWRGVHVVTSLAGRTARPVLPAGAVRVGGFADAGGLAEYLAAEAVDAVLDATHPYAARMSATASDVCSRLGLPLLVLRRSGWVPQAGDRWAEVDSLAEAAAAVERLGHRRAFLAIGRQGLPAFAPLDGVWFLIRCVDPPAPPLPAAHQVVLDRGPFAFEAEVELLRGHRVEAVVSKNSGGQSGYAKIEAARHLGLPVVMVRRPPAPPGPFVTSVEAALDWVQTLLASRAR
jgi:precorrin-6A/cobalt-precorrin-6A reductase